MMLIRPNTRNKNYQELARDLSAMEPPLWMAMRAAELKAQDREVNVIDGEVTPYEIDDITDNEIEIFPTGSHPSAFIQQKEGIKELALDLIHRGKNVKVWGKVPDFSIETTPLWEAFPITKYRTHNWHCWGGYERQPYGITYTSLGCPFNCSFCAVNGYYNNKYTERDLILTFMDIEQFVRNHGVKNIKIIDEMFFLKKKRVEELCDMLIANSFDLNIWAYARIDTVEPALLSKLRRAGFRWLGLGVESGDEAIRRGTSKGSFTNNKIRDTVSMIRDNGIHTAANYIFGFLDDDINSMKKTLDFAKELNCEYANFNPMMPFPGSQLYEEIVRLGWDLPKSWSGYSYYSYDAQPVRTKYLTSIQVLKFRDNAFMDYFTDNNYLAMIRDTFGKTAVEDINEMTKIKLKRKFLE